MKSKKRNFVIYFLLVFINSTFSQVTFQKTYGGTQDDYFYSVQQTTDGGYIMVGSTNSFGAGDYDVYLVKTDLNGDTLWTRTYGGAMYDQGLWAQQTTDSGYIVIGSTQSFGAGQELVYLIKTKANGDSSWTKTYKLGGSGSGLCVQQTSDGGYILDCIAYVGGEDLLFLIKTNSLGDTLWTKSYGMSVADFGGSIQQTTDSGYIVSGTRIYGNEAYLLKSDVSGNLIWKKSYPGGNGSHGFSVKQTADGGYIVIGSQNIIGPGIYLVKTDSLGDTLWTKAYGGDSSESGFSIQLTSDSGYIIAGVTNSFGAGNNDTYLIKTNSTGDTLWTKTFGTADDERSNSVQQTIDGGYILAGGSYNFAVGNYDGYLIKTDANGNSGCYENGTATIVEVPTTAVTIPSDTGLLTLSTFVNSYSGITGSGGTIHTLCSNTVIKEFAAEGTINVYPNPAFDYFTIDINADLFKANIEIRNILGEKIYSAQVKSGNEKINCKNFSSGIYIVSITNGKKIITKKLIVNR